MDTMSNTLLESIAEVNEGLEDARADFPDVDEYDILVEIIKNIAGTDEELHDNLVFHFGI
jgi:hypothetical protein